ncbi:MAG: hypothetical protein AB7K52_15015 [Phycisphaerales bacterium]
MSQRRGHEILNGPIGPVIRRGLRAERSPDLVDPIMARLQGSRAMRAQPASSAGAFGAGRVALMLALVVGGAAAFSLWAPERRTGARVVASAGATAEVEATAAPAPAEPVSRTVVLAVSPLPDRSIEPGFAPGTVAGQVESTLREDNDWLALR